MSERKKSTKSSQTKPNTYLVTRKAASVTISGPTRTSKVQSRTQSTT